MKRRSLLLGLLFVLLPKPCVPRGWLSAEEASNILARTGRLKGRKIWIENKYIQLPKKCVIKDCEFNIPKSCSIPTEPRIIARPNVIAKPTQEPSVLITGCHFGCR